MKKADFGDRNDWGMTILAALSLLNVGLRVWRPPAGFDPLDRAVLGIFGAGIVSVWLLNFKHRQTLKSLPERDEKPAMQLNIFQRQSAFWVYMIAMQAPLLLRHH